MTFPYVLHGVELAALAPFELGGIAQAIRAVDDAQCEIRGDDEAMRLSSSVVTYLMDLYEFGGVMLDARREAGQVKVS